MPRSYLPTHNFFTDLFQINTGNTQPILDVLQNHIGVRFTTPAQQNPVQPTIVVVSNTFTRAVGGITFDAQFPLGSNSVLLVFVDGVLACQINQSEIGTNLVNTGEVVFGQQFNRGVHTVAFELLPTAAGPAELAVQNVELGYDPRPLFLPPEILPSPSATLLLNMLSMEGRTNYVVETSANLSEWTVLTNIQSTNLVIPVTVPIPPNPKQHFFRFQVH